MSENAETHIIDALGRSIALPAPPRRIVSLVPSLTEYLFAIDAGDLLVGVTDYCMRPAERVAQLPKVRGTKNPDRTLIQALQPDLVLAVKEENRERDVRAFEAMGLAVYVADINSVADAVAQLGTLAALVGRSGAAEGLLDAMRAALVAPPPAVHPRVLAFIWREPWMAIGGATYAHDLLRLCGADNVALQLGERYPRAALETFMQLDPQVILLPSEPYAFTAADRAAFAAYPRVSAVAHGRIVLCDGELLTWYGPRTVTALQMLRAQFESGRDADAA